jgi:hypothetical protein
MGAMKTINSCFVPLLRYRTRRKASGISMKHEAALTNFEMLSAGKHWNITQISQRWKHRYIQEG